MDTRPFNLEYARTGAPYACANGEAAMVLKWDCRHPRAQLAGVYGPSDYAISWSGTGEAVNADYNLVMAPLGYVEDKPVFVGHELVSTRGRFTVDPPFRGFSGCKWPTPEPAYPETKMSDNELLIACVQPTGTSAFRDIANAAIRHAIKSGQVVLPFDLSQQHFVLNHMTASGIADFLTDHPGIAGELSAVLRSPQPAAPQSRGN